MVRLELQGESVVIGAADSPLPQPNAGTSPKVALPGRQDALGGADYVDHQKDQGIDLATLLAPDSDTHTRWMQELDLIAADLQELKQRDATARPVMY